MYWTLEKWLRVVENDSIHADYGAIMKTNIKGNNKSTEWTIGDIKDRSGVHVAKKNYSIKQVHNVNSQLQERTWTDNTDLKKDFAV